MSDFTIGVDFGTQSVRAIVVRCSDGTTISESTFAYPHGVLDRSLPDGTPLPRRGLGAGRSERLHDGLDSRRS